MEHWPLHPHQLCWLAIAGTALLVQLLYFLVLFVRIAFHRKRPSSAMEAPVSVLVCARNEERHLRSLIPELMDQDYPEYEVVVVDDSSWDDTPDILRAFEVRYPNLKVVTLDDEAQRMSGKKFAVTMGIKAAAHNLLLFTDADCRPSGSSWLRHMAAPLNENKAVSIGYSPYQPTTGVLGHLIRYDAFFTGVQYLSFALAGLPYMGVGRNLGYRKDLFMEHGGFKSHLDLQSGDDDLFVNEVAHKANTGVVLGDAAITRSEPKTSWQAWWRQKRRHLTTGIRYRAVHKALLGLYPLSWLVFHAALVGALVFHTPVVWIIAPLILRWGMQIAIFSRAANLLGDRGVAWFAPLSEAFVLAFTPTVMLANMIQPPKQWK